MHAGRMENKAGRNGHEPGTPTFTFPGDVDVGVFGLELWNSLCLTLLASELTLRLDRQTTTLEPWFSTRRNWFGVWLLPNIVFVGVRFISRASTAVDEFLHNAGVALSFVSVLLKSSAARALVVAAAFAGTLWLSLTRTHAGQALTPLDFVRILMVSVLESLPILPIIAVGISFAFLVLVSLCQSIALPTSWLNWPIYFGVLYGPFATIFFVARRRFSRSTRTSSLLPR